MTARVVTPLFALLLLVGAAPAEAQERPVGPSAAEVLSPRAGTGGVPLSLETPVTVPRDATAWRSVLPQARDRSGIPWMVAGGALFVAGAITGDTAGALMMVGGGVAGAYGLFVYFGGDVEK